MTAPVKPEKKVEKKVERTVDPKDYYCEIILERTTKEKAEDKSFPTDAFNVKYIVDGKEYLDVTVLKRWYMFLICTMMDMGKEQFYQLIMVLVV